ncbi:hypothetical protein [Methylocystis heyeri]|uniref:Uncharacterized protein n=1 Tax=Methylocystis heyeri TaxID=391905 RepID=A0A6B8KD11_9HYPH|nr:hypothetical protein [Methylocystis heyeri]QGM44925.1 hypothetical protein H2LOC_004050 [Methylocystis heyeri]
MTPPAPPSTQWLETVLYSFAGGQDAANPTSTLTLMGGALNGSALKGGGTGCGGSNLGTVFTLQCAKAAREVFGGAQHAACAR